MEEDSEFLRWDELMPDALGLIFGNLSMKEILIVIPRVCKSWGRAVAGPYCWQEIDIESGAKIYSRPEIVNRRLQMLIARSLGSFCKLCVSRLPNDESLSIIANHAKSLLTLRLSRSKISDSIVELVAPKLSTITFLNVSSCTNIRGPALEAIGKHCKHLTGLRRNMDPLEIMDRFSQDDEALAISATMLKLKQLEMAYSLINTEGVLQILLDCPDIQFLDVRGCWNVKFDEETVNKFFSAGLHLFTDCFDRNGWDNCSDYSGSSEYLAWDFIAGDLDYSSDDIPGAWDDDPNLQEFDLSDIYYPNTVRPPSPRNLHARPVEVSGVISSIWFSTLL